MNCKNHSDRLGVNTCSQCGEWLCQECAVEIGGRIYCTECLEKAVEGKEAAKRSEPVIKSEGTDTFKAPAAFLVFLFAFVPGCGQMYMGLMKRGLSLLILFSASCYLSSYLDAFMFVTMALYLFGFFDTFNCRSKIMSRTKVNDDINDLKDFVIGNKVLIVGAILIMVAFDVSSGFFFNFLGHGYYNIIVLALVLTVILYLFKDKKNEQ